MHVVRPQLLLTLSLLLLACPARAADYHLKLDLSPLLVIEELWEMTPKALQNRFRAQGFAENPYLIWPNETEAVFSPKPFANITVDLTALDGQVISFAKVHFAKADAPANGACLSMEKPSAAGLAAVVSKLTGLYGEPQVSPRPAVGWRVSMVSRAQRWQHPNLGVAILQQGRSHADLLLLKDPAELGKMMSVLQNPLDRRQRSLEFFVRVDEVLELPELWSMTPDRLEADLLLPGGSLDECPFFKWNTTSKEGARFAQKLFNNTDTALLLFNDTVNAEEVNVDFTNKRASRVVVTLLSRGTSGQAMDAETMAQKFDHLFVSTGRALSAKLGVRPVRYSPAGKQIVKTEGWLWTSPHSLALLEFNSEAPKGNIEFCRLTLTPGNARAQLLNLAGIGNNATTRSKGSLTASVRRDAATGDVEISGVPMRDQGQRGYCVAASCERLFRYLGQPCDMDELALLVAADAERGASPANMYDQLRKIDQRYNMRVKLLKIPPDYALSDVVSAKELDRARRVSLSDVVQTQVNAGLPLLWCVLLNAGETGLAPGVKGRRNLGGPRVGHMRLITGYNAMTKGIIYTDSWGAGHERKVMSLAEAEAMTTAVFSMAPSR
jgi:Peptidase_C39 like family